MLLSAGFHQPAGALQLATIALGMFVAAGTAGPAGAMVANLTHFAIHGTAFATLTLANNLLGLAPGPFVTGALADRLGLQGALQVIPCIGLAAALAFLIGKRYYARDLERVRAFTLGGATERSLKIHVATYRSAAGECAGRRRALIVARRGT